MNLIRLSGQHWLISLERDINNQIQFDQSTGLIKTHTAVLYKESGKYLVIDPNNAAFSAVLVGVNPNLIRIVFTASDKEFKIYQSPEDYPVGPKSSRDCIDVSTKLALNLTVTANAGKATLKAREIVKTDYGYIHPDDLRECISIKEITNLQSVYEKLPKELEYFLARGKQSSDVLISKSVTPTLVFLTSIIERLDKLGCENYKQKILSTFDSPDYSSWNSQMEKFVIEVSKADDVGLLGLEHQAISDSFGEYI